MAGFFLPDLLLYNMGIKRQVMIQRDLPDAMDMLTICVESGLGFDAALARVARNSSGPVAAEFTRALQEIQIGKSRSQALRSLAERTTVPELRAFTSAVVQAGELGIPIADVLREQAKEMRMRRRQRAEEKAQQVPVKILFPLIGCLFPALFIIVIGPGAISIMHSLFHALSGRHDRRHPPGPPPRLRQADHDSHGAGLRRWSTGRPWSAAAARIRCTGPAPGWSARSTR